MNADEIRKQIEKVEEMSDLSRIEFKFPKLQALATLEVALQLAILNETRTAMPTNLGPLFVPKNSDLTGPPIRTNVISGETGRGLR